MKQDDLVQITEPQVARYLQQHPEFFIEREDLLTKLFIPHVLPDSNPTKTVSLVEKQVSVLRKQNRDLRQRLNKLLEIAKDNDKLFEKTKRLILALLDSKDWQQLNRVLDDNLRKDFTSDVVRLYLFDISLSNTYTVIKSAIGAEARTQLAALLKGKTLCGILKPQETEFLFTDMSNKIGSAAVVPLVSNCMQGVLAIGSFDAKYFNASMGTLLLTYVGEILTRTLNLLVEPKEQLALLSE